MNEFLSKLKAPHKFSNSLKVKKKLGAEPKVNDKYLSSFVVVDESAENNTSDSSIAGNSKVLSDHKKPDSCVLLENSGFDLAEDNKWNNVEA